MKLLAIAVCVSAATIAVQQFSIANSVETRVDGKVLACFQKAYEKHKEVVVDKKYWPIQNYTIGFYDDGKNQVLISFDPIMDEGPSTSTGSISSKGLGFEYLMDKRSAKVLKVMTIP